MSGDRIAPKLNARRIEQRLSHLREFVDQDTEGVASGATGEGICCDIPTSYSYGAHSPSYVAFEARRLGLGALGTVDELSIGAANELYEACKIVGIGSTFGFRLEVSFDATPIKELLPSCPDGTTLASIELYGVPFTSKDHVQQFLRPIQDARNARQRKQVGRLNKTISSVGLGSIDYDAEVLSYANGTVTDMHVGLALARRVLKRKRGGQELVGFLRDSLKLQIGDAYASALSSAEGQQRAQLLAKLLRVPILGDIALPPNRSECIPATDAVSFAFEVGAIPSFHVVDLPEDPEALLSLLDGLVGIGFAGITYAPAKLSEERAQELHRAAVERELLELPAAAASDDGSEWPVPNLSPETQRHLIDASWALVAHQQLEACNPRLGLLSAGNPFYDLAVPDRAAKYAELGRRIDPANPESACEQLKEALV